MQAGAPDKGWYSPAAHAVHTDCPVLGWKLPTPQAVHAAAPTEETAPEGHAVQTDDVEPAVTSEYSPATQPAQAIEPVEGAKVPAAQLEHALAPYPE